MTLFIISRKLRHVTPLQLFFTRWHHAVISGYHTRAACNCKLFLCSCNFFGRKRKSNVTQWTCDFIKSFVILLFEIRKYLHNINCISCSETGRINSLRCFYAAFITTLTSPIEDRVAFSMPLRRNRYRCYSSTSAADSIYLSFTRRTSSSSSSALLPLLNTPPHLLFPTFQE